MEMFLCGYLDKTNWNQIVNDLNTLYTIISKHNPKLLKVS